MEAFGIMGFILGLGALGKIIMLEKQLKESGVLKEKTESNDKWFLIVDIPRMKKQNPKLKAQLLLGFLLFWIGCGAPRDITNFTGHTMGTTFSIRIIPAGSFNNYQKLELGIDSV